MKAVRRDEDRPIRVGVIGLGDMGVVHCAAIDRSRDYVLLGAADPDPGRRDVLGRSSPAIPTYSDAEALLGKEALDLVVVASPPAAHRSAVELATRAGLHVLCEKPLAPSRGEAEEMARAGQGLPVVRVVNLQLRFALGRIRLRELVNEGAIGRLIGARAAFGLPGFDASAPGWFAHRRLGGGVLMELGSHHIDQLRWLMGDITHASGYLSSASPAARSDAHAVATLRFASGCVGEVAVSARARFAPRRLFEVYGETGTLRLESDDRLQLIDAAGTSVPIELPVEEFDSLTDDPLERFTRPLQRMLRHLANVLRNAAQPGDLATFDDAVAVQSVIEQIEGTDGGHAPCHAAS